MTDYHPEKGDRVRVTRVWEGVVGSIECTAFRVDAAEGETYGRWFDFQPVDRGLAAGSVEKIADPEPQWDHGDLISLKGGTPKEFYHLIRKHYILGNFWEDLYGNEIKDSVITTEWQLGLVKILYKADS